MSLLAMPKRPAVQGVYYMPSYMYDDTDLVDHPLLVVGSDQVTRHAFVATRTTKPHAKGPKGVPHPAGLIRELDLPGWWRLHRLHDVPWQHFNEPETKFLGRLDDDTWTRVQATLNGKEETR